jgi:hydroxymethylpyrimidine/phosphomethylpyrimidine kinase
VSTPNNYDQPTVLTIAGFDPSGGAGIIADIRTLVHFGCRPTAAITSLTFQNSQGVFGAAHETAESLRAQIVPIVKEFRLAALKIGMLPTAELVCEVAGLIREGQLPAPVIDPVMRSSSGPRLMEEDAFEVFVTELLPLSRLVTPNIPEAEKLAGVNIVGEQEMQTAAARIRELGARAVLVKGGHLEQGSGVRDQGSEKREAIDVLDDQGQVDILRGEWIDGPSMRGTGCMLSSAIAACVGKGISLAESVSAAKIFVAAEIQNSTLKTEYSKLT